MKLQTEKENNPENKTKTIKAQENLWKQTLVTKGTLSAFFFLNVRLLHFTVLRYRNTCGFE